MSYAFPFEIATLSSTGDRPQDGAPLRAAHFNRLFREVLALEAAIGLNPEGDLATMILRLGTSQNGNGTYERELICEDDPSGNARGTTRFMDSQWSEVVMNADSVPAGKPNVFIPLAYSPWDEPPVFIHGGQRPNVGGFSTGIARRQILAISEVGVNLDVRNHDGAAIDSANTEIFAWLCISRSLHVWEEDVAWCLPPARTGS